jgi:hypothetical protein
MEGNSGALSGVAWDGAAFTAIGAASLGRLGISSVLFSSPDGNRWTRQSGPAEVLVDLAWGNKLFVAVGGGGRQGAVFTSPDLHEWVDRTPMRCPPLRAVRWSGAFFVAVGVNGAILTSVDGTRWSERPSRTEHDLLGVACHDSFCVAVGDGVLLTSTDGAQWRIPGSGE